MGPRKADATVVLQTDKERKKMVFFGTNQTNLLTTEANQTTCRFCHQTDTQIIKVEGTYAHIWFLPLLPLSKKVRATCSHCKKVSSKYEFSSALYKQYELKKEEAKWPLWYWAGSILLVLAFFTFVV